MSPVKKKKDETREERDLRKASEKKDKDKKRSKSAKKKKDKKEKDIKASKLDPVPEKLDEENRGSIMPNGTPEKNLADNADGPA